MKIKSFFIGMLSTNCYLVYDEDTKDAIIIDPADHVSGIDDFIKKEDLNLRYIVLTHGHGDHIGGVESILDQYPDTKLVAGVNEADILEIATHNVSEQILGRKVELKPDIYVNDGDVLEAGSLKMKIIETPGHTPGGICILIEDNLFSGDTLFRESVGRTDFYRGSMSELLNSIQNKLFKLPDDTKVYPGHMGPTEIGYEKKNNPFA